MGTNKFSEKLDKIPEDNPPVKDFHSTSSCYAKEISMSAISVWEVRSTSARRTLLLCEHAYQAKYVP